MSIRFEFNASRCAACGACVAACMDQNDLYPANGDLAFRRCETSEERNGGEIHMTYLSVGCMHCEDAACMDACPCSCFYRDEETGFVLYDNDSCVNCGLCRDACPYKAPVFPESSGKMEKCDGCAERVKHGMEPACVQVCPFDALRLIKY